MSKRPAYQDWKKVPWSTVLGFGVTYDRARGTVSVNASKLILDACDKFGLDD